MDRLSGSWPERFVPRWGSSKEREREEGYDVGSSAKGRVQPTRGNSGGSLGMLSDDDPLDGEEGVVVDDEACFVDGWEGKVGEWFLRFDGCPELALTESSTPDFLCSFPQEISLYILLHLDFQSLLTASTVSRQWHSLCFDNVLWRDLFHQEKHWRIREDPPDDYHHSFFPFSAGGRSSQPNSPSLKRAASTLSRAASLSKRSTTTNGASEVGGTPSGSRISKRLTDMMADLGGLSLTGMTRPSRETEEVSPTSSTSEVGPFSAGSAPGSITPRRPTAVVLPTNAFATPPSHSTYDGGPSLSRSSSRNGSSAALSSLASSLSALPPSLGPSRRASSATLPPLGPVPSPSLAVVPSAPLFLDWPKLYRDRYILDRRWKKGKAKSTFLKGHTDSVYCLQFDDRVVISGSVSLAASSPHPAVPLTPRRQRDQTIRVWDLRTAQCIKVLTGHEGSVLCLQSDSKVLISGSSDSRILVWDLVGEEGTGKGQWEVKMSLVGHNMGVLDLCFDEKWIVSCSKVRFVSTSPSNARRADAFARLRQDTTIRVWHRSTGELYRTLSGHRGPVNAVQLLNNKIVSASGDSLMKLWDVLTGEILRVFSGHERGLACVKLSASGKLLVSGSNDRTVRVWDADTGECLKVLSGHADLVRSLAIDEEGGRVVSASYDRTTRVWDWKEGKEVLKFKGHTSLVFDVAFSATRIVRCVLLYFSCVAGL